MKDRTKHAIKKFFIKHDKEAMAAVFIAIGIFVLVLGIVANSGPAQ